MKVRRCSAVVVCLVLSVCTLVYSAKYDQNGMLSLLKGDLNRDGYISLADIGMLASAWLEQDCGLSNQCARADVFFTCGDGSIDSKDFAVIADALGQCVDPCNPDCTHEALTLYEPPRTIGYFDTEMIALFSGEFYKSQTDMRIPGRGIPFSWRRWYRSRTGINTTMGNNWSPSYDIYLEACSGNIILHGPTGRRDFYYAQPKGTWAAPGFFRELIRNFDFSFSLIFPDTSEWRFNSLDDPSAPGKINTIVDRNGNALTFDYDGSGKLVIIHTALDDALHSRDVTIAYNADGFVKSVRDWAGRQVKYEYYSDGEADGSAGDLKSVTTPVVIGTVTGNDFPDGKTTVYTYSTGFDDDRLNHNLLTITDPNGTTYLRNIYFGKEDPKDRDFDRVKRQIRGEPNDIIDIRYRQIAPRPGNNYAVMMAIVNDRAGNVRHYWFDQYNQLVILRQYTGFAPDPDQFTDLTRNRPTGKLRPDDPNFFVSRFKHNEDHLPVRVDYPNGNYTVNVWQGDLDPNASPRSRGNLRERHRFAGALAPVSDQSEIVELFEYDPTFNHGTNFPTRYVNGRGNQTLYGYDPNGNRIRTTYKRPGPPSDIVEEWEYDTYGRLTASIRPDNGSGHRRRDERIYYMDANDPNYGYLKSVIVDGNNLALTTTYKYDRVGNVICETDPNGGDRRYIYNQLNQIVRRISREVNKGSGVRYKTDIYYDDKDNVTQVDVQNVNDVGPVLANSHFTTTFEYDILNFVTRITRELTPVNNAVTEYEHDENRNRTLTRYPEATSGNDPNNVVRREYDERNLLFRRIRAPQASGVGGKSTTQYDYDSNGNLTKVSAGIEADTSPSYAGDSSHVTIYTYDGYNRVVSTSDPMGNIRTNSYDENSNLIKAMFAGEPNDISGSAGNIRLAEAVYEYDELDRRTRTDVKFFDSNSQIDISDGNSTMQIIYSQNSQVLSTTDDNGNTTMTTYDTANRPLTVTDAKSNSVTYSYTLNSKVKTVTEVDKSDLGSPDEFFVTTYSYDGLDRRIRTDNNIGSVTENKYDSRSNVVEFMDSRRPLLGNPGNVTRYAYDAASRLIRTVRHMTNDGTGTGAVVGTIVTTRSWDDNSRQASRTDGNSNVTSYAYDSLGRLIKTTHEDNTETSYEYDVHGNRKRATDGNGSVSDNRFDAKNRLIDIAVTRAAGVLGTTFENFSYDGLSRIISARDDDSTVEFIYDSLSGVVSETLNGQITTSTNDGLGNKTSLNYPGGLAITYAYDALNRMSTVSGPGGTIARYYYIGPYRKERRRTGSGGGITESNYTYDLLRRMTRSRHVRIGVGPIDDRDYSWDQASNLMQRRNLLALPIDIFDYQHDSIQRMVRSLHSPPGPPAGQTDYHLDDVGDRITVTVGGVPQIYTKDPTMPEPADYQMNQYTTTPSYTRRYDRNGNLKVLDLGLPTQRDLSYNYRNLMTRHVEVSSGTQTDYQYDAFGRRIAKVYDVTGTPVTTLFFYNGNFLIEEQSPPGVTTATYVEGAGP